MFTRDEAAVDGDGEFAAGADVDALPERAAGAASDGARGRGGGGRDGAEALRDGEVRYDQVVGARNGDRLRDAAAQRRSHPRRGGGATRGCRAGGGGAGVRRADLAQANLQHR